MAYQINLEGFEDLKIDPRYKINVNSGVVLGLNNKILKSKGDIYHRVNIGGGNTKNLSRLVWSQVNGSIDGKFDVDHIDNNPDNNSISNLQLLTHQENLKKSAKNRDYSFSKTTLQNIKRVKAIKIDDGTFEIYKSLYSCMTDIGVNAGLIKMCCEKSNRVKSGTSRINNNRYTFEYTDQEPTKLIKRKNAAN